MRGLSRSKAGWRKRDQGIEMAPEPDLELSKRPLVRADDIAEVCDVSSRHVLAMAANGRIPCVRLGKRAVRFIPSDVETALELPPGIIRRATSRRTKR
jgi:excisionase family DNA binding protein